MKTDIEKARDAIETALDSIISAGAHFISHDDLLLIHKVIESCDDLYQHGEMKGYTRGWNESAEVDRPRPWNDWKTTTPPYGEQVILCFESGFVTAMPVYRKDNFSGVVKWQSLPGADNE